MSALAKILLQRGRKVQGSDLTSNALLKEMETIGAKVHIGHHSQCIGDATTIVYSSGIKGDNVELIEAKRRKLPILHRSELLDFLAQPKKKILVAGTHGKTTTTALLAHVMKSAGLDPSFVVGGMARCLQTNGKEGQGEHFVMEADESDVSFLKTRVTVAGGAETMVAGTTRPSSRKYCVIFSFFPSRNFIAFTTS